MCTFFELLFYALVLAHFEHGINNGEMYSLVHSLVVFVDFIFELTVNFFSYRVTQVIIFNFFIIIQSDLKFRFNDRKLLSSNKPNTGIGPDFPPGNILDQILNLGFINDLESLLADLQLASLIGDQTLGTNSQGAILR